MKRLFTALNLPEAGLLRGRLESEGIACWIKNEQLAMAAGEIPFTECYPELWVLNDEDFPRAKELFDEWQTQGEQNLESWVCAQCGAANEGQFGACWNCGAPLVEETQSL